MTTTLQVRSFDYVVQVTQFIFRIGYIMFRRRKNVTGTDLLNSILMHAPKNATPVLSVC